MNNLGQKLRESRENQNLLLRQVAAFLEVDTALISKVERGERNLNRDQVIKLSLLLDISQEELISLWLCDKIIGIVGAEKYALQGMKKALKKLKTLTLNEK